MPNSGSCGWRRAEFAAALVVACAVASLAPAPAHAAAAACSTAVPTDFDGGGPDVAIGYPSYDLPGKPDAGAVVVFSNTAEPGDPDPRPPTARTVFTAASFGLPTQAGARFGASIVTVRDGDIHDDDDGCANLIVGAPGETVGSIAGAGRVHVLDGAAGGFAAVVRSYDAATLAGAGGAQTEAGFGAAVSTAGGVIAIGEPGRDIGSAADAGRVTRIDYQGPAPDPVISFIAQGAGTTDAAEAGDRFGEVLEMFPTGQGPLIIVGVPRENVGSDADAGAVVLISPAGPVSMVTQDSAGAGGAAEPGDRYGAALDAFATFTDHPVVRVAIGVPGEDTGSVDAGAVAWAAVDLFFDPDLIGPILGSGRVVTQNSAGVPGSKEASDAFGTSLVIDEFGTDGGRRHLVVGTPLENIGSIADGGMLSLSFIREDGGPASGSPLTWTENSPGAPGSVERGDQFGSALAAVLLSTPDDDVDLAWPVILVTVPREDIGSVADAGVAHLGLAPGRGSVVLIPPFTQRGAGIGMAPMRTE